MTIFNFSAGPSALFPEVIEKIKNDLGNWNNLGVSVMEVSHRSPEYMDFYHNMLEDFKKIMEVPEGYSVLFLQGGARLQFAAIPLNIEKKYGKALYLNSGHWSNTAAKEASKYTDVTSLNLVEDKKLVKTNWVNESTGYDYVHYCPNETVDGIEIFDNLKIAPNVPLVADLSSTILSRKFDVSKFDVIYAGAQKNIGCAGVTVVIVKESLLKKAQTICPDTINWTVQTNFDSMINTPATFSWYICGLTFKHLLDNFGNLEVIENYNNNKATKLYNYLDNQDFYKNNVDTNVRSRMNVCFYCPTPELDQEFVSKSKEKGFLALKGHKIVGGIRASIYNSINMDAIDHLINFMEEFKNNYSN